MMKGTFSTGDDRFSISANKITGYFSMPEKHFHDKYEIYYLVSGERHYFIKDRVFLIKKGHLVFVNEGEMHKTTDAGAPDHQRILLYFTKDFLRMPESPLNGIMDLLVKRQYCVLGLSLKEQQYTEKLINDMYEEIKKQSLGFEICLLGTLMRLLVFMARCLRHHDENAYVSTSPKHEKISEIVRYINTHYMEPLSIPKLSDLFYISPYYLSRVFKETTGFTLVEYINNVRIKEAQKLIVHPGLKVIEAAEKTGFGSLAHFNRVFRNIAGCSPLKYRKIMTEK
ncbi:MAG: AraC family transcriptional regulator [Bacillota bacterium]